MEVQLLRVTFEGEVACFTFSVTSPLGDDYPLEVTIPVGREVPPEVKARGGGKNHYLTNVAFGELREWLRNAATATEVAHRAYNDD